MHSTISPEDPSGHDRVSALARAAALNEETIELTFAGELAAAERNGREVLEIRQRLLAGGDPLIAQGLANLASVFLEGGRYEEAMPLVQRAHAISAAAFGPDAFELAPILNTWAMVHEMRGEYAEARPLYERALALVSCNVEPDDPILSFALNNLARLLIHQGDEGAAIPLLTRAISIMEAARGPENPLLATPLNNLGVVLVQQKEFAAAKELLRRVLQLRQEALGPRHPLVALSAGNLAVVLMEEGEFAEAAQLLEQSLDIARAASGPDHYYVATALNNLGWLATHQYEFGRAQAYFQQAIHVLQAIGADHVMLAKALSNTAQAAWLDGDGEEARRLILRATEVLGGTVVRLFHTLAPAEQRAFVDEWLDVVRGFVLCMFRREAAALPAAYEVIAGWKGLLLLGLRYQSDAAAAPDEAALGERSALRQVRTRVAHTVRSSGGPEALVEAESERERLERALAATLSADARLDRWAAESGGGLAALRGVLPADAAFVDIYHYPWLNRQGVFWMYGALVITRDTEPVMLNLGLGPMIDGFADTWRAMRDQVCEATVALALFLWEPITAVLPAGTRRVWVAPDGGLSRLPWSALAATLDGEGAMYVAQVPSARALLDLLSTPPAPPQRSALLVGDVDFGIPSVIGKPQWRYLPGTAAEVEDLARSAVMAGMRVRRLVRGTATPAAVAKGMEDAAYVHLATHGFFGGSTQAEHEARYTRTQMFERMGPEPGTAGMAARSPLATSGIALAGANTGPHGNLTAEEIVGLDLRTARLVVLSACDTGRGAEVTGQGVLGLQAAVQAAGARALLMSLWPVSDNATATLMASFYHGLWEEKRSPAAALRHAQAEVRARPEWEAPRFWAGWSLVGDVF